MVVPTLPTRNEGAMQTPVNRRLKWRGGKAVLSLLGVGTLMLVGCAAENAEPTDTPDPAPAIAEQEQSQAPEHPAVLTGEACLAGTWEMRLETFAKSLEQMMRESEEIPADIAAGLTIELDGHSYVRFDGNKTYTAWVDDYTMAVTAAGQTMVHHQNSGESATYGVEGDLTWISAPVSIFFEATMTPVGGVSVHLEQDESAEVSVFGMTIEVPGVDRELIDGAARFSCEEDVLTLTGDYDRIAEFTRAPEGTQPTW